MQLLLLLLLLLVSCLASHDVWRRKWIGWFMLVIDHLLICIDTCLLLLTSVWSITLLRRPLLWWQRWNSWKRYFILSSNHALFILVNRWRFKPLVRFRPTLLFEWSRSISFQWSICTICQFIMVNYDFRSEHMILTCNLRIPNL